MRFRLALVALAIAVGLLWRPFIQPAGQSAVLILGLFTPALVGTNVAARITPEPRVEETRESFDGVDMRVTWWRPGWGDSHAAIMMVNGATPQGNDNAATRDLGAALARAGFMAMLPEFPFLRDGRFDTAAPRQLDAAFARLRARPENVGRTAGAFGASVGGGALLVTAGREPALRAADFLVVLGAYYDLDTYLASVVSWSQRRDSRVVPWVPSQEAQERLPPAAVAVVPTEDQARVRAAMVATSYDVALERIRALPGRTRAIYDALSPELAWPGIAPPVFWLHDPNDAYEPVAEAEAARDATRDGRFTLVVPGVIQHAEVAGGAGARGPLYVLGELLALLGTIIEIVRLAG